MSDSSSEGKSVKANLERRRCRREYGMAIRNGCICAISAYVRYPSYKQKGKRVSMRFECKTGSQATSQKEH